MKTNSGIFESVLISLLLLDFLPPAFAEDIDLQVLASADLGSPIGQLRAVPVAIGEEHPHCVAVMYSEEAEVDPWEGMFFFPRHTLKLAVRPPRETSSGRRTWGRELFPAYGSAPCSPLISTRMALMKSG